MLGVVVGVENVERLLNRALTPKDMAFMDTFYFTNTEDNVLEYNIRYPSDQCCYRLVIFDESYGQWGGIRPNEDRLTCRDKIDRVYNPDYRIILTDLDPVCHVKTDAAGFKWLVCHGRFNFASRQRPQSYFVHLTNCRSNRKGLRNVTYSLHMTNGNNGLMKEFAENQKSEIFSCLSTILFVSVLLLVSKGFTITRAQVSLFGTLKMIVFGLVYGASYTVVFFDQRVLLDPQDIIASVTSMSAGGLIGIKFGGCIVFVYGCFFTIKNYPKKALFYLPFTLFFSVWFMTEPTYRLLSIYVYPVLQSPNIWNGIDLVLSFAGHAYFLCITRPDLLNKRFPFHLQAGKISFRDIDDDVENIYQASPDYSVFQTGKNPTGTGTTLSIHDAPDTALTIHDAPDTALTIHDAPDTALSIPGAPDTTLSIHNEPEHFFTPVI
ncbi:transmembrane protein 145-like [Strongylocentrotus purpuratus]|uniref:Intimal thickness related receptor IRP domain-containing protein n=1 Tax=Strongylocentrotus purpuratus TaxID=7668 RepID=A0A7M7PS53_STRPU|nr:transmembrane protein 145-like [Strongylocentrotus purpuratus]